MTVRRVLLQVVLLPPYLVFCCLLFGIDALCDVLTRNRGEPRR